MIRFLLTLVAGIGVGVGGMTVAHHDGEKVKVVSERNIVEKLDGKEAKATVVEVTIEPGEAGVPHRHPVRDSDTSWKGNTNWGSTISRRRCSSKEKRFTSQPDVCTGCRRIRLRKTEPA